MKILPVILPLVIFVLLNNNVIAACKRDTVPSQNNMDIYYQYLKKSNVQKKTGLILGISGGALAATGMMLALSELSGLFHSNGTTTYRDYGSTPGILAACGGAMVVAAIPFSIESRKNKKKAQLYIAGNKIITPGIQQAYAHAGLGIKINF